jgi:hypothetical protein
MGERIQFGLIEIKQRERMTARRKRMRGFVSERARRAGDND